MHVVVEPAQVEQFESQPIHVLPLTIVLPVCQLLTQVLSLKSSFILAAHVLHVVVVPEHVLQLESQATHSLLIATYSSEGHDEIHTLLWRNV